MMDDIDLRSYQASYIFPIMSILKIGVWHCTTVESFRGIQETGFIYPNTGQFKYTFPQSEYYYAHSKGFACLFDFESAQEEDYIFSWQTWAMFFVDDNRETVALRLNRHRLPRLLPNHSAPKEELRYIGFVEVWYPEPIPVSAIDRIIVTKTDPETSHAVVIFDSEEQV